jgi:hypothetical protein
MSDALITYAWPVFAVVLLALITWGPTLVTFFRKRRHGIPVTLKNLGIVLALELLALIALAAGANAIGLSNAGGYLLVIALLIGAGGAQLFSSRLFR